MTIATPEEFADQIDPLLGYYSSEDQIKEAVKLIRARDAQIRREAFLEAADLIETNVVATSSKNPKSHLCENKTVMGTGETQKCYAYAIRNLADDKGDVG